MTARDRPFLLGLTGSIGMGKSTTAEMFRAAGVPVWDADAAVHRIYRPGGPGAAALAPLVPGAVTPDGGVERGALRGALAEDPGLLGLIEERIHPLVAEDRADFLARAAAPLVVCDIPLLFETGADTWLDAVLVVTAPPEVQRARVMARPGMTAAEFDRFLARQMPDARKRARADYLIDTSLGLDHARAEVHSLIARLSGSRHA
ncbi:dephospho-CoA kinase [Amaricoccus solimangrovi]|uniref:Dephospho-CoA kinase n=1 Tax=Amaricoccus solimangrovi TaxID=2589815 RepID=A0A501WYF2_9RHOB|nr:dephospho-CoA kinase [Amaricoccus solimangrovi]TPE52547.1 dephospho-CoA kinase [Amaricoccus solimangrovi]